MMECKAHSSSERDLTLLRQVGQTNFASSFGGLGSEKLPAGSRFCSPRLKDCMITAACVFDEGLEDPSE